MAKRKVIWSRRSKKKLYAILESDIRKRKDKSFSKEFFKELSGRVKRLGKNAEQWTPTSDKSVCALVTDLFNVYYEMSDKVIFIHTIEAKF